MKSMAASLAIKKAQREASWSLIIIVVMSVGLTGWIAIPSVGASLQSALFAYTNSVSTYIVVQNNGNPSTLNQTISQALLQKMASIKGVQRIYPIVTNYTIFTFPDPKPIGNATIGNKTVTLTENSIGFLSAVIGGNTGYPSQLIDPAVGTAPQGNESGFIFNSLQDNPFNVSDTAHVHIANDNFTAKELGVNKYVPILGNNLGVLWNVSFMEQELGPTLFQKTFGEGTNFVVIKMASVDNVPGAVTQLTALMAAYSSYIVIYDQAAVDNLISVQDGLAPFYTLLGALSLILSAIAVLVISYVAISRRGWEAGLLVSQGWQWSELRRFFFAYFLILASISMALSLVASEVISKYSSTSYEVYGGFVSVAISLEPAYLISAAIIAVALTGVASIFMTWKLERAGLDRALREY